MSELIDLDAIQDAAAALVNEVCRCPNDGLPHLKECKPWHASQQLEALVTPVNVLRMIRVIRAAQLIWDQPDKTMGKWVELDKALQPFRGRDAE